MILVLSDIKGIIIASRTVLEDSYRLNVFQKEQPTTRKCIAAHNLWYGSINYRSKIDLFNFRIYRGNSIKLVANRSSMFPIAKVVYNKKLALTIELWRIALLIILYAV